MSMHRLVTPAVWVAMAIASGAGACRRMRPLDEEPARKERILENLKARYPELAGLNPTLSELKRTVVDEATMTLTAPNGTAQPQHLFITMDGKAYLTLGEPVDVSLTPAELEAARAKARAARAAELAIITQGLPVRGPANAPVTVVEFTDFQCPFCRMAASNLAELLAKHPQDLKLVVANFPLPAHPWARPAAIAAMCAARQSPSAFWTLYDAYFRDQRDLSQDNLIAKSQAYLAGSDVNPTRWRACVGPNDTDEHQAVVQRLDETLAAGKKLELNGTPTFFVDGEQLTGAVSVRELERAVSAALARQAAPQPQPAPRAPQK